MKTYLKQKPVSHSNNIRSSKPYWNEDLSKLWKEARFREKAYIKIKHNNVNRAKLRAGFVCAQHNFDRELRKAKRRHALKDAQILSISKRENTPCFWNIISRLKSRKTMDDRISSIVQYLSW